jgi:hypothetical protein
MEVNDETSVKVAVRIRPLNASEVADDSNLCITVVPGEPQVRHYMLSWFMACSEWLTIFLFLMLLLD